MDKVVKRYAGLLIRRIHPDLFSSRHYPGVYRRTNETALQILNRHLGFVRNETRLIVARDLVSIKPCSLSLYFRHSDAHALSVAFADADLGISNGSADKSANSIGTVSDFKLSGYTNNDTILSNSSDMIRKEVEYLKVRIVLDFLRLCQECRLPIEQSDLAYVNEQLRLLQDSLQNSSSSRLNSNAMEEYESRDAKLGRIFRDQLLRDLSISPHKYHSASTIDAQESFEERLHRIFSEYEIYFKDDDLEEMERAEALVHLAETLPLSEDNAQEYARSFKQKFSSNDAKNSKPILIGREFSSDQLQHFHCVSV